MSSIVERSNFGHAAFTKPGLAIYDLLVLRGVCRYVWRCPIPFILRTYDRHLTDNHLEAGVGTGFFLDSATFPGPNPRLALLDLNVNCLDRTAARVARYAPEVYQANLLAPIELGIRRFDSVAMNYVLHCLPGGFPRKAIALANLHALLNPGGVLFGATVLQTGAKSTLAAQATMALCNAFKTLNNAGDSEMALRAALNRYFTDVEIAIVGCVAIFSGRVK